jgi:hypothetical protein
MVDPNDIARLITEDPDVPADVPADDSIDIQGDKPVSQLIEDAE